ncbi:MAG TPA: baseplate J/gp47 family protein [Candidatus Acidoferrum sp.]|jgi:hypothetical protein|nr:baseplate J/gp47 family protein [Candidatus Acidoferrum sp.]
MAANPIYVETEEEIPELVERLRRYHGEDTMLVLPTRSRIGQSRFNFQLLRNYAAGMGKRVTVVCDDPAVQKMASESGFAVFGTVGAQGEGIPSAPVEDPPIPHWWQRDHAEAATHIGIAQPTKLITRRATELRPGRFILNLAAAFLLLMGVIAAAVYVPSASVTLLASAQPFSQKAVEIQASPGKPPIRVRAVILTRSVSQGFKTTGSIRVLLAAAFGQVIYSNNDDPPPCPGQYCNSPGYIFSSGQRLMNTNGIEFAQTTRGVMVPWHGTAFANVIATTRGAAGNVGSGTINTIEDLNQSFNVTVTNTQATGGGSDASNTPQETIADFGAARTVLESELRQSIAEQIAASKKSGETLSDTLIYGTPVFSTDHQPTDKVASFNATMSLQGEGDFYFDADVKKAYETYLAQRVPNNQQLLTDAPIQVDYRVLNATAGGQLVFLGDAAAFIAPKLDMNTIRSQIVGRQVAQARFYLQSLNVRSVTIKEQPLPLPLMPLLSSRISIHYNIDPAAQPTLPPTG